MFANAMRKIAVRAMLQQLGQNEEIIELLARFLPARDLFVKPIIEHTFDDWLQVVKSCQLDSCMAETDLKLMFDAAQSFAQNNDVQLTGWTFLKRYAVPQLAAQAAHKELL